MRAPGGFVVSGREWGRDCHLHLDYFLRETYDKIVLEDPLATLGDLINTFSLSQLNQKVQRNKVRTIHIVSSHCRPFNSIYTSSLLYNVQIRETV